MTSQEFGYDAVSGKYLEATSVAVNYHQWILDEMKPFLGQNILEVGAGIGLVTEMLEEYTNKNLYTIEPSEEMYPQLIDRVKKQDRLQENFQGTIQSNKKKLAKLGIDSAIYINVLEHIEDDTQELKDIYSILEKGGYVCTFSPAMPWLYSKRDARTGHFRRYTKAEKEEKMKEAGFEIVKSFYMDSIGSLLWWGKFVALKSDNIGTGSVGLFDKVIVPIERNIEPRWMPFGKNVMVIGKKK